ncbi:MAG: NAD-dependent epimerase/dehydratase family protein [Pirellulales bacterium]|nr:NAD-dependent epimerase/dehydratase family protein [Pirellulales bacterium]
MMESTERIFVTGGTGFIGTRLVQALTERGHRVRVLSRRADPKPPPGLEHQGGDPLKHERVELVRGDVTDRDSLLEGMEGCSHVFHLAAYAKNWARNPDTYFAMNVRSMRNVFDVAEQLSVRRVVWTSTIMTFGPTPPGVVGDEQMPRATDTYLTQYEQTKTIAEREALQRATEGFPVVIVNPTRVYGPGHLTEGNALSTLIRDYDRGRVPVLLNRGVNVGNYVLVDDVVQGHILAMEKGGVGQCYILGGENATLRQFFRTIDQVSGKRHFQIPLLQVTPLAFAYWQKKRAEWFGTYPRITPGWVRTFLVDWAYRTDKAERELGYRPTPLVEGVRITYQWLQRIGELP